MSITSSSSPADSTTFGPHYKQVKNHLCHFCDHFCMLSLLLVLIRNRWEIIFVTTFVICHFFWSADLPWRTCENDWNTPTCRSPYEHKVIMMMMNSINTLCCIYHKVSDVCHLSEEKYPCAALGEDYRDCVVRYFIHLLIINVCIIIISWWWLLSSKSDSHSIANHHLIFLFFFRTQQSLKQCFASGRTIWTRRCGHVNNIWTI